MMYQASAIRDCCWKLLMSSLFPSIWPMSIGRLQLAAEVRCASQPLSGLLSQLWKPKLQLGVQTPALGLPALGEHATLPFAFVHWWPQPPQLFGSVVVLLTIVS